MKSQDYIIGFIPFSNLSRIHSHSANLRWSVYLKFIFPHETSGIPQATTSKGQSRRASYQHGVYASCSPRLKSTRRPKPRETNACPPPPPKRCHHQQNSFLQSCIRSSDQRSVDPSSFRCCFLNRIAKLKSKAFPHEVRAPLRRLFSILC